MLRGLKDTNTRLNSPLRSVYNVLRIVVILNFMISVCDMTL